MAVAEPSLDVERTLFEAGARYVFGCDEVGRGALAGPVAVGIVAISSDADFPVGLRDSKLMSEPRRVLMREQVNEWMDFGAVGVSSPEEVDTFGITVALGLAGARALSALPLTGRDVSESVVLLDGTFDWLSSALEGMADSPVVRARAKADRDCAAVAAASVLAKVSRDETMLELSGEFPGYGWEKNKGYGTAAHFAAIAQLGPNRFHRHSWLKQANTID